MKKVIYLTLTVVILFNYGCNSEEFEKSDMNVDSEQIDMRTPVGVYNFDIDGNPVEISTFKLEYFDDMRSVRSQNNQSINGHFTNQSGSTTTLSAMQNNGGAHGNILISGGFGSFRLDVLCVWNEDNVGMAGGIILENGYNAIDGFPFGPGDSMYLVFQDNGEGSNAEKDQYVQAFFYIPLEAWQHIGSEPFGICEFLPPPSYWDTFFSTPELCGCPYPAGLKDVLNESDQIQVN